MTFSNIETLHSHHSRAPSYFLLLCLLVVVSQHLAQRHSANNTQHNRLDGGTKHKRHKTLESNVIMLSVVVPSVAAPQQFLIRSRLLGVSSLTFTIKLFIAIVNITSYQASVISTNSPCILFAGKTKRTLHPYREPRKGPLTLSSNIARKIGIGQKSTSVH